MKRILAAFVAVTLFPATHAVAATEIPRPPAVLSPDLSDPWLLQLKPGRRLLPVLTLPRLTRTTLFAPPTIHPAFVQPPPRQIRPASVLVKIPGSSQTVDIQNYPIPREFLPQVVAYQTTEPPGTIVIDTPSRHLYLVMPNGQALRYGVGVGKPGFEWAGVHTVSRMAEWPDWTPPSEMLQRRPELPRHMDGGPSNPLGARALYLGSSLYRIHGSNEPWTIGHAVSSGCIRMRNQDVMDLYQRVSVGAKVIVI